MPKKCNYRDVYFYAKEHGKEEAAKEYGLSIQRINTTLLIGGDIINGGEKLPPLKNFTPRQLMEELAERGFTGKLAYTQTVDLAKL